MARHKNPEVKRWYVVFMIGVPRKLSVCLFERNLLLGLKTKALKLSKDSSFKGGSFPKL